MAHSRNLQLLTSQHPPHFRDTREHAEGLVPASVALDGAASLSGSFLGGSQQLKCSYINLGTAEAWPPRPVTPGCCQGTQNYRQMEENPEHSELCCLKFTVWIEDLFSPNCNKIDLTRPSNSPGSLLLFTFIPLIANSQFIW